MELINSLNELLNNKYEQLNWDGALFVNRKKWSSDPKNTSILYLEGDDELEDIVDSETHLPKLAQQYKMQQLLDIQTFQDVIEFQKKNNPNSNIDEYIHALKYYLENDDFYESETAI